MSILDSIKLLKPAERFKALLILAALSVGSSVTTAYLKTDDCRGISTQYENLVDNHTRLMQANNKIIEDNNAKTEAIRKLDSILVAFSQQKAMVTTRIDQIPIHQQALVTVNETARDSGIARSMPVVTAIEETPKIMVVKTTTDLNKAQKDLVRSALKITKQYKNN